MVLLNGSLKDKPRGDGSMSRVVLGEAQEKSKKGSRGSEKVCKR